MTLARRRFPAVAVGLLLAAALSTTTAMGASPAPSASPGPTPSASPAALDPSSFTWFEAASERGGGSTLRVGRFDGWSRLVARSEGAIVADGPQDGLVAAVVPRRRGTLILLVDARTGDERRFLRTPERVGAIALDQAHDQLWWTIQRGDEEAQLWRASLKGGEPERMGEPEPSIVTLLSLSADGSRLVRWGLGPDRMFARVLDVATGDEVAIDDVSLVVGVLGDRVVDEADCSEICYPLRAIDAATGDVEVLVDGPESFARMSTTKAGRAVLIAVVDGRYVAIDADGGRMTLAAVTDDTRRAVRDTSYQDAEAPGYLPLLPDGRFVDEASGESTVTDAILLPLDGSLAIPLGAPAASPVPSASPG